MVKILLRRWGEAMAARNGSEPGLIEQPERFLKARLELVESGRGALVLAFLAKALAARPGDALIAQLAARIARHRVPRFHAAMLRDAARNAAYRRAIDVAAPGKVVLDIGDGSGLLAMMAARAGAAHVYACERNPQIAARCREIVAANGLAAHITVLPVRSTALDRARDLSGGAELVVSEIFSRDLLGEGVLPALAHARAALCRPGARFLPERAALRVALADGPPSPSPLSDVEGFDLTALAGHVEPPGHIDGDDLRLVLRSAPSDLFAFDFNAGWDAEAQTALLLESRGGRVGGIAQWLRIECGAGAVYENAPSAVEPGHWGIGFYPLPALRETAPGKTVAARGWHGETAIAIWAQP